jgi:hypothetical protein
MEKNSYRILFVFFALILVLLGGCTFAKVSLTKQERSLLENPPDSAIQFAKKHVGEAHAFFKKHEKKIGHSEADVLSLSACMLKRAELLGVISPQNIKVVIGNELPIPRKDNELYDVYVKIAGDPRSAGAITYGKNIYIRPLYSNSYNILIHELVHVMQFQKYGEIAYLEKYMTDAQIVNYHQIPFESEAFIKSLNFSQSNVTRCKQLYN